jgi:predicted signal transduction protein with EAL and GGDEF domain
MFQFYTEEMNARALDRLTLENSLRHALERNEFLLHYQPQIDLRTGRISGVEALLLWRHPSLGLVSPSRFLPIAEDTGLIEPIGEWAIRAACIQSLVWQAAGLAPLRMAVNLRDASFVIVGSLKRLLEFCRDTDFPFAIGSRADGRHRDGGRPCGRSRSFVNLMAWACDFRSMTSAQGTLVEPTRDSRSTC